MINRDRLIFAAIVALVIVTLIVALTGAARADLATAIDATCRISHTNSIGTGCAFAKDEAHYYVLTNAHVVDLANVVRCQFWNHGAPAGEVAGRVLFREESGPRDVAVVAVPRASVAWSVPVVPLGQPDYQFGSAIASVGCARGQWPTAWQGYVTTVDASAVEFMPAPADGRSGSAILDHAAERIVGLIAWRTGSVGRAISLPEIYAALQNVDCGPGGCFPHRRPTPPYRAPPLQQIFPPTPQPQPRPLVPVPGSGERRAESQEPDYGSQISNLKSQIDGHDAAIANLGGKIDGLANELRGSLKNNQQAIDQQAVSLLPLQKLPADVQELHGRQASLEETTQQVSQDTQTLAQRVAGIKAEIGGLVTRIGDFKTQLAAGGGSLTFWQQVGTALGLSGPMGLGFAAAGWLVARRLKAHISGGQAGPSRPFRGEEPV